MLEQSKARNQAAVAPGELDAAQRPALRQYRSWQRFHAGPRQSNEPLLRKLECYPNAVLVAGCQRSGTTMLTRIIAHSAGFRALKLTHDDELDAALTLCGAIDLPKSTRYCFQTTYLNERFGEYRMLSAGYKLIWVLRNPYSVVRSMVYNWKRFALNELYEACAVELATDPRLRRTSMPWPIGPSRLEKGCFAYAGKTRQILKIREFVPADQLMIVEYDELVSSPQRWLPQIFDFISEPYSPDYAADVRADSVGKANTLSQSAQDRIKQWSLPTYEECKQFVSPLSS